jgi:D-glycero-D-manno-heptose 1,7-bisphosphate phosphatase
MPSRSTSALFLDRDGTINVDRGYVHTIDQFEFLPGIFDLARFVSAKLQWPIIVATNQSGIGRGFFDERAFALMTRWMCERFREEGAPLTHVYHCPYHPEHGIGAYRIDHPWRKPQPGMFLQAASDYGIALSESILIGDAMTDIEAGAAAGIGVLIRLGRRPTSELEHGPAHTVVADHNAALQFIRHLAIDIAGSR